MSRDSCEMQRTFPISTPFFPRFGPFLTLCWRDFPPCLFVICRGLFPLFPTFPSLFPKLPRGSFPGSLTGCGRQENSAPRVACAVDCMRVFWAGMRARGARSVAANGVERSCCSVQISVGRGMSRVFLCLVCFEITVLLWIAYQLTN